MSYHYGSESFWRNPRPSLWYVARNGVVVTIRERLNVAGGYKYQCYVGRTLVGVLPTLAGAKQALRTRLMGDELCESTQNGTVLSLPG